MLGNVALTQMAIFLLPDMRLPHALYPMMVLSFQFWLALSAHSPIPVFLLPVLFEKSDQSQNALLSVPAVFDPRALTPMAVFDSIDPAPFQIVIVPTLRSPSLSRILSFSLAFVLNTISVASLVPIKLVPAVVPVFQRIDQSVTDSAALDGSQVARPFASLVRILPRPGDHPVIRICPFISSVDLGSIVPIPM